jgi:trk system potassium uptake protein TrkA
MLRRLLPEGAHSTWSDPTGHLLLVEIAYDGGWVGRSVRQVQSVATGARIGFLTRYGEAILPTWQTVIQDGDLLHVLVERGNAKQISELFAQPPKDAE